jgi:hypothetical protein
MQSFVSLLVLPLVLLNSVGGLVALVWLVILGQWAVLGYGILAMIAMPPLFALVQLPALGFTAAGAWLSDRNWRVAMIVCVFLGALWTNILVVGWCLLIVVKYVQPVRDISPIPILLWGYTVAVGPLAYMARKDGGNPFTSLQMLIAQLFVIAIGAAWLADASAVVFFTFMLVALFTFPLLALILGGVELALARSR